MSWILEKTNSWHLLKNRWTPNINGRIKCGSDLPQFVFLETNLSNMFGRSPQEIQHELKCMLRAPWEIFKLHIEREDGTFVTQDDFKEWYHENVGDIHTAIEKKPSTFLTENPTWTDGDGNVHTTDVFSCLKRYDGSLSVEFEFSSTFHFIDSEGELLSYAAGHEWLDMDDVEELGIVALGGKDVHGKGWDNRYRITLDAESETFDDDVEKMTEFIQLWSRNGLHFPYNFSTLPPHTGMKKVSFAIDSIMRLCSLVANGHEAQHVDVNIIDTETRMDNLTNHSMDWSRYAKLVPHRQSRETCLSYYFTDSQTQHVPDEYDLTIAAMFRIKKAIETSFYSKAGRAAAHPDIDGLFKQIHPELDQARRLLNHGDNRFFHRSEGILVLEDSKHILGQILDLMRRGELAPEDDLELWTVWFNNDIKLKELIDVAIYKGQWSEDYRLLERPLYEKKMADWEALTAKIDKLNQRKSNPEMPVWGEILLIIIAVAMITGIGVVIYVATRKQDMRRDFYSGGW